MSDDEFVDLALAARANDEALGWQLLEVRMGLPSSSRRARVRIRLIGYDMTVPPVRQERCFAYVDRSPRNAAAILARLMGVT